MCAELPNAPADPLLRAHPYPYAYLVARIQAQPELTLGQLDAWVVAWTSREESRDPQGALIAIRYEWPWTPLGGAVIDLILDRDPDGSTHIAVSESGTSSPVHCAAPP